MNDDVEKSRNEAIDGAVRAIKEQFGEEAFEEGPPRPIHMKPPKPVHELVSDAEGVISMFNLALDNHASSAELGLIHAEMVRAVQALGDLMYTVRTAPEQTVVELVSKKYYEALGHQTVVLFATHRLEEAEDDRDESDPTH